MILIFLKIDFLYILKNTILSYIIIYMYFDYDIYMIWILNICLFLILYFYYIYHSAKEFLL